jgi:preprotein translocase subunit SecD
VVHQPFPQALTSTPNIGGHDITLHKGLDLQGGTELVIAICRGNNDPPGVGCRQGPPNGASPSNAQTATIPILQQRVNSLGVSEALVQAQGSDQILIQLPGVSLQQAIQTVGTTAKLHFATPVQGAPNPADPAFIADQQNFYNPKQFANPLDYPTGYHWKFDDNLKASDVTSADVGNDSNNGQIGVTIDFNGDGAQEWSKITTAAFAAYQTNPSSPQAQIAIFLDNDVISAPQVIQGGQSNKTIITGQFTSATATALANQISAGALPAQIATVQTTEVSATLGQDAVRSSIIAGAVGLLIVVIFMVGYYRFPGILASLALIVYAAIVLAMFKLIGVTLTLAGLAGFVLSVGMAVDANVLIFERTRDE